MADDVLATSPFVVVRIACRQCSRAGAFRLARFAAKFGPEMPLADMLARFSYDCLWRMESHAKGGASSCGVYLPDIEGPSRPPNLPPGMVKLRVVKGGKAG